MKFSHLPDPLFRPSPYSVPLFRLVITSLAGFERSEPAVTEGAAVAGAFRPQLPGVRIAIPADLK